MRLSDSLKDFAVVRTTILWFPLWRNLDMAELNAEEREKKLKGLRYIGEILL